MGGFVNSRGIEQLIMRPVAVNKIAIELYALFKEIDWKVKADALYLLGYVHPGNEGHGIGLNPSDESRVLYCDIMELIGSIPDVTSEVLTMALEGQGYIPKEQAYGKDYISTSTENRKDKHQQPKG